MMWTARSPSGELYVLRNGVVIYKRWPNGTSRVFGGIGQGSARA